MQRKPARQAFLFLLTMGICGGSSWAADPAPLSGDTVLPPQTAARLAWRVGLPLRSVDTVQSCQLVEGNLYAISSDGSASCVRADTGQLLWSRRLEAGRGTVYPPVAYHSPEFYGVAFTLSSEVVLVDPTTGSEYKRVRLLSSARAACSTAPGLIFSAEANNRLRTYDMKDNVQAWQILGEGPMTLPPLYQPDLQTVAFADESGLVAMVWGNDKEEVYARKLGGAPQGWIGSDGDKLYVSTSDNFVNCLNRTTGETLWQYRLPGKPEGGPVICNGNIYQAVALGGVQRVSIDRQQPNWFDKNAVKFLCEWGGRPAMLYQDGRVAIDDATTGQPMAFIEAGPVGMAVSNTVNEALLLVSATGEIRCLQPAEAEVAALASFRPPTTQPTSQPTTQPVLARKPKAGEEAPLWSRSSGTAQANAAGSGGTHGSRSDRSTRSSRSSRSSSSSARGDRSSSRSSSRGDRSSSRSSRSSRGDRSSSRGDRSSRSSRGDRGSRGAY